MRRLALLFLALLAHSAVALSAEAPTAPAGAFIAIAYHEVRSDVRDYPDPYAVDDAALVAQFAWLRGNGYSAVSVDEIIAARHGGKSLPAKAVLLTFDDAYLSFYTRVYPLLREFGFPAVLAVVGKWIDTPQGEAIVYGEKDSVARASFPTWAQLREMAESGFVEIASHTYDLHHGILANPQGNLQPAATTRLYDPSRAVYETDAAWRARVRADLARNAVVIERETGKKPRTIVWPYGSYNEELVRIAGALGSPVALTLDDGPNTVGVPLAALRRTLVEHYPSLADFIAEVRGPQSPAPVRALRVRLDDVYSADPVQQEKNLSAMLDRVQVMKPTRIYLQAYAGDGLADEVYFPNRHLPVRADLFNRVAWQLMSRTDAAVLALLPVDGFRLPKKMIAEVYEDLARDANFSGLLFSDQIPSDEAGRTASIAFTQELAARVRAFRAPLVVARSLPVAAISLKTTLPAYLAAYDEVVLMTGTAPNDLSGALHAAAAERTLRVPRGPSDTGKLVFMLHDAHEAAKRNSASTAVAAQMRALQLGGVLNFAYWVDDVGNDDPPLTIIAPAMSLRVFMPQTAH